MPADEELDEEKAADLCPETVDGAHVVDHNSVVGIDTIGPGEQTVVDVHCSKCGRSGSFLLSAEDIQW